MPKRVVLGFVAAILITIAGSLLADRHKKAQLEEMHSLFECHVAFPEMSDASYAKYLNEKYRWYIDAIDAQVESADCNPGQARVARWHRISVGQMPDGRE